MSGFGGGAGFFVGGLSAEGILPLDHFGKHLVRQFGGNPPTVPPAYQSDHNHPHSGSYQRPA